MKFLITFVSLCVTSIFYISEVDSNFFILIDRRLREIYSGHEWNDTDYFRYQIYTKGTRNMCEEVKKAKIFFANRPLIPETTNDTDFDENEFDMESQFFLKEAWLSETNEIVPEKLTVEELLFNDEIINTYVIICEFGKSQKDKIYLARQKSSKHLFLFGKINEDDTNTLPKLLAIVMNYLPIKEVNLQKSIGDVVWALHKDKTRSNGVAEKLFKEDGVDIFQLCASILFHEESDDDKETKYKYIITIPGPQNNLRTDFVVRHIATPTGGVLCEEGSYPAVTCQVKQKAGNKLLLKFKFYIIPDITTKDLVKSKIFVKFEVVKGLKIIVVKTFMLTSPWSTAVSKRPRSIGETENN